MTEMPLPQVGGSKEVAEVTSPVKKMHILICYDKRDVKHLRDLDQHLQLMYRRLGSQVSRHYFGYRTIEEPKPYTGDNQYFKDQYQKEKAEYEKQLKDYTDERTCMIRFLQQGQLLLILYVSNVFMERLWNDMAQDSQLSTLLTNPNHRIAPVLITPTAGFAGNCEPLCAFEGTAFEVACQQITTNLETIARDYFGEILESPDVTPFTLLTSPSTVHVSIPSATAQMLAGLLDPIQKMFEQANTRVVEAQRLAIAERSTDEERLSKQLDGIEQRLSALQAAQNASPIARFSRWLGIPSSK